MAGATSNLGRASIPMSAHISSQISLMGSMVKSVFLPHRGKLRSGQLEKVGEHRPCLEIGFDMKLHFWGFGEGGNEQLWESEHRAIRVDALYDPIGVLWQSIDANPITRGRKNWVLATDHPDGTFDRWDRDLFEAVSSEIDGTGFLPSDFWERAPNARCPFDFEIYPDMPFAKERIVECDLDVIEVHDLEDYKTRLFAQSSSHSF